MNVTQIELQQVPARYSRVRVAIVAMQIWVVSFDTYVRFLANAFLELAYWFQVQELQVDGSDIC